MDELSFSCSASIFSTTSLKVTLDFFFSTETWGSLSLDTATLGITKIFLVTGDVLLGGLSKSSFNTFLDASETLFSIRRFLNMKIEIPPRIKIKSRLKSSKECKIHQLFHRLVQLVPIPPWETGHPNFLYFQLFLYLE